MAKAKKVDAGSAAYRHPTLGAELVRFLNLLRVEQHQLADAIPGATAAVVSNWVNGQRRPTRDTIWQIAQKLGSVARKRAQSGFRMERIDAVSILLDLLRAGDYEVSWEGEYDAVWEDKFRQKTPRKFRIGYADTPPFMDSLHRQKSICWRIADRVVRELEAEPDFIPTTWSKLTPGLESGEFDLIAPILMRVPTRAARVMFSRGIGLISGYCALVPSSRKSDATTGAGVLRPEKIKVLEVAGEIGQLFCQFATSAERFTPLGTDPAELDLRQAAQLLLDEPDDSGKVPCMISEIITCENLVEESRAKLTTIPLPSEIPMWYPLAFACHLREKRLCDAINLALENLQNNGTLHDWFHDWLSTDLELFYAKHPNLRAILVDPTFPPRADELNQWVKRPNFSSRPDLPNSSTKKEQR